MRKILLDLNHTLVTNSNVKVTPFARQIDKEEYSAALVDAIRNDYVILITARPQKYRLLTLASIHAKTGWKPHESYFNEINLYPPAAKQRVLREYILPMHGQCEFLAIESNPKTRAMYARNDIPSVTRDEFLRGSAAAACQTRLLLR